MPVQVRSAYAASERKSCLPFPGNGPDPERIRTGSHHCELQAELPGVVNEEDIQGSDLLPNQLFEIGGVDVGDEDEDELAGELPDGFASVSRKRRTKITSGSSSMHAIIK